jgi:hypothetical protein
MQEASIYSARPFVRIPNIPKKHTKTWHTSHGVPDTAGPLSSSAPLPTSDAGSPGLAGAWSGGRAELTHKTASGPNDHQTDIIKYSSSSRHPKLLQPSVSTRHVEAC